MPPTQKGADRKARRQDDLERERERAQLLRAAAYVDGNVTAGPRDVLTDFPTFSTFQKHGLVLDIFFSAPEAATWTTEMANFVFDLTRLNMRTLYEAAPDWGWRDAKKRAELYDAASRYLFVRDRANGALVAFAVFRFLADGDVDVLYVYELQLTESVQRKGLGKHLMVLMELIARRAGMQWCVWRGDVRFRDHCTLPCSGRTFQTLAAHIAFIFRSKHRVFLTVLRSNVAAFNFYTKLKYTIDEGSPSRLPNDDPHSLEASHEILSKAMPPRASPALTHT